MNCLHGQLSSLYRDIVTVLCAFQMTGSCPWRSSSHTSVTGSSQTSRCRSFIAPSTDRMPSELLLLLPSVQCVPQSPPGISIIIKSRLCPCDTQASLLVSQAKFKVCLKYRISDEPWSTFSFTVTSIFYDSMIYKATIHGRHSKKFFFFLNRYIISVSSLEMVFCLLCFSTGTWTSTNCQVHFFLWSF